MSWNNWNELVDATNRIVTSKKNNRSNSITKPTHIVIHITGTDNFESVKNRFLNESASAHYLIKTDGTIVQFVKDKDRAWHAGIPSHIENLYDQNNGCWKKYLKYFNWYSYPAGSKFLKADLSTANIESEKKLVATGNGTDWEYYSYWVRHGTRNYPINFENNNDPNDYSIGIELLSTGGTLKEKYVEGLYTGLINLLTNLCGKYNIPKDRNYIVGHEDVNPVERWGWDPNSGFDWDRVIKDINAGGTNFPVDIGWGKNLDLNVINSYYTHTEKESEGGYFPVGANTLWHGGLHIHGEEGSGVFACMSGKIVAGRLAGDAELAAGPFGHRNFLLLEHEVSGKQCFSLYMHLSDHPLDETDEFIQSVAWLQKSGKKSFKITGTTRNYRSSPNSSGSANILGSLNSGDIVEFVEDAAPAPWKKIKLGSGVTAFLHCDPECVEEYIVEEVDKEMLASLKKGDVVKIDRAVQAGDLLWKIGKYGPKTEPQWLVHWEIFSKENLVESAENAPSAIEDKKPEGLGTGYTAGNGIKVRGVAGPASAAEGETITCIVTKIDFSDAPEAELNKINWKVLADDRETKLENHGYKLEYAIPEKSAGKTIKIYPYMNNPSDSYCVSISITAAWTCIEDPDDDFNAEHEAIAGHFGDLMADGVVMKEELKKFYAENPGGKAEKLRNFACKFASEWGITDLDAAVKKLKKKGWAVEAKEYKPYIWWQDAVKAGVTLPSAHVWHYNPIRFLETFGQPIAEERSEEDAGAERVFDIGIKKCEGPSFSAPGGKITCKVTEYTKTPSDDDKKNVSWCVKRDGTVIKEEKHKGEQFEFSIPETLAGATLTVHPFMNSPSDTVCSTITVGPYLLFDGAKLTLFDKDLKEQKSWNAVSGRPGFQAAEFQKEKDKGPIPEGYWYVKQDRLQHKENQSFFNSLLDDADRGGWPGGEERWGKHRVWVSEVAGTDTFGRSGFVIHGGKTAGSAGGIDLSGGMDGFVEVFEKCKTNFILWVKYTTSVTISEQIVFGKNISNEFKEKVKEICDNLSVDVNYVMAAMAFETGETFSPSIKNAAGSGAIGLIQFMPATATALGTTISELEKMTAVKQLEYVEKYFNNYRGNLKSLEDVYMAILWPAAIGKPNSYVLFEKGSKAYSQNIGLDSNGDGKITKAEAAAKVRLKYDKGTLLKG